jgi:DNA mismatch repair protein MutL
MDSNHSPQIRQLSPTVINKIAAGEVIERPASVVKELVENSLDAGARRVDVTVEQGGADLIRVVDDGCGIAATQLTLALASHATSKIENAEDLFRVESLGFRGEALASIASVSRLSLRSRPAQAESAALVEVVGGEASPIQPASGPPGTCIEVRNLFFNTPVRRKFLRTTQTEAGHVAEAITRLALSHPQVHFTLTHGKRLVHDLPPTSLMERITQVFGEELAAGLLPVASHDEEIRLSGFVANPAHSRPNNRMQYMFLNGRFIRDRSLQHALGEAYRGLLLTGRYPICFLQLTLAPASVDVNVHPTKLEVRFEDGGRVYSELLGTLRTRFLATDLVARANLPTPPLENPQLQQWAQRQFDPATVTAESPGSPSEDAAVPPAAREGDPHEVGRAPLGLHRVDLPGGGSPPAGDGLGPRPNLSADTAGEATRSAEHVAASTAGPPPARGKIGAFSAVQIHNRYLVTESEAGMEVIDQHALHERILYEAIRTKVLAGGLESQRLLTPEPVDVTASEAAAALEQSQLLAQLGLEISPFGGETLLLSSYPAMLSRLRPADILRSAVELLTTPGKRLERRDLLDELLHMMSCKAAVKYGDPLTPQEIESLLAQRHLAQDHHHCPHGRPTALVFTRAQLDRQFKRI